MTELIIAALGAGFALGLVLLVAGLRCREVLSMPERLGATRPEILGAQLAAAVVAGLVGFLATGWPVRAVGTACAAWWASKLLGGTRRRRESIARTEAIAAWTEMIRDTISGSTAIQQALESTAEVGPRA